MNGLIRLVEFCHKGTWYKLEPCLIPRIQIPRKFGKLPNLNTTLPQNDGKLWKTERKSLCKFPAFFHYNPAPSVGAYK